MTNSHETGENVESQPPVPSSIERKLKISGFDDDLIKKYSSQIESLIEKRVQESEEPQTTDKWGDMIMHLLNKIDSKAPFIIEKLIPNILRQVEKPSDILGWDSALANINEYYQPIKGKISFDDFLKQFISRSNSAKNFEIEGQKKAHEIEIGRSKAAA